VNDFIGIDVRFITTTDQYVYEALDIPDHLVKNIEPAKIFEETAARIGVS